MYDAVLPITPQEGIFEANGKTWGKIIHILMAIKSRLTHEGDHQSLNQDGALSALMQNAFIGNSSKMMNSYS